MMRQRFFLILVSIAILSCNGNKSSENQIDHAIGEEIHTDARFLSSAELLEGIELPVFTQKINTKKEIKLQTPTGAEIKIPENAFVDKAGNQVNGEVTIKYKEIKSPADIIIENVDMTYDSLGKSYQFATAGMFDLRAFSNDEELFIKQGKSIEVSYISDKPGNYNFYYNKNGWKYAGIPKENLPLNAVSENEALPGILKPVAANPSTDLILDIKNLHRHLPELAVYKNILWKYSGKMEVTEVGEILSKAVTNESLTKSGKSGEYIYRFTSAGKNFEFPVQAVFSPKAMKEAMNQYNAAISKTKTSSKIKRVVDITQLGLMNYDVIYKQPNVVLVKADFNIKNNESHTVDGLPLFHITGDDNVLVDISGKKDVYFSNNLNNKLIAILPGRKVAVMGTSEFIKATDKRGKENKVLFELTELETVINSPDDLNAIISGL